MRVRRLLAAIINAIDVFGATGADSPPDELPSWCTTGTHAVLVLLLLSAFTEAIVLTLCLLQR